MSGPGYGLDKVWSAFGDPTQDEESRPNAIAVKKIQQSINVGGYPALKRVPVPPAHR